MDQTSKLRAQYAFEGFTSRTSPTYMSNAFQPSSDEHLLIQPKKLANPVMESKLHASMQRELTLNNKMGVNVLNQKSELTRVFQERQRQQCHSSRLEDDSPKSEFELVLEKRRKCSEKSDSTESDASIPEFVKMKEKLRKA